MVHKEAAGGHGGRENNIRCAAPSMAGSAYNIEGIGSGKLEFGVVQSDVQFHAVNGSGEFAGKQFTDLRAVFSVYPEPLHIIVGADSGINGWDGLKGKRVNIGNPGSGQRATTDFLLDAHGMSSGDFALATEMTSTEQSAALCDGKIDAYVFRGGSQSRSRRRDRWMQRAYRRLHDPGGRENGQ